MSFLGKIFGKKDDDFGDLGSFDDASFDKLGGNIPGDANSPFGAEPGLTPAEDSLEMPQQPVSPQKPQQRQQYSQPAQPHDDFSSTMQSPYPQHDVSRAQPTVSPSVSGAMQYQQTDNSSYVLGKNLEIISYKLDALRAAIDSLSQRVANLERIATQEEPRSRGGW
ncbi:hypothetical protein JXA85_03155 [Candidatus Woesearchaeota archaeon]|nr:hypothetical protein [Candidatus Woesearchaeota archaeon]